MGTCILCTQKNSHIHTYTHTHTHKDTHTKTHTQTHTRFHTQTHTQTHTHIHINIYTYTQKHTHTHSLAFSLAHTKSRSHNHTRTSGNKAFRKVRRRANFDRGLGKRTRDDAMADCTEMPLSVGVGAKARVPPLKATSENAAALPTCIFLVLFFLTSKQIYYLFLRTCSKVLNLAKHRDTNRISTRFLRVRSLSFRE